MKQKAVWGNYLTDYGYFATSNLLIDKQEELGLDDKELLFIIKVSRYSTGWVIKDANLTGKSSRTYQRIRNTLKAKGYLKTNEHKKKDRTTGKWINGGISYDLSGLNKALEELYEIIVEDRIKDKENDNAVVYINDNSREEEKLPKKLKHLLNIWRESYERFHKECPEEIRETVTRRWINQKSYKPIKRDFYHLTTLTDDEIKQLEIGFKHLDKYLINELSYGDFIYNGEQMIPKISLFIGSSYQYQKLIDFAKEEEIELGDYV